MCFCGVAFNANPFSLGQTAHGQSLRDEEKNTPTQKSIRDHGGKREQQVEQK